MAFTNYLKFVAESGSGLLWRMTCKALHYIDRFNAKTRKSAVVAFLNCNYPRIDIVFYDLGAAGGMDPTYGPLHALPNFKAIGFDPNKKNLDSLETTERVQFYPFAIAGSRGKRTLYVTKSPGCSSLFPPNEENLKEYPLADLLQVVRTEEFDVITLDEFVEQSRVSYPDFLKLDVQGAEYEIFKAGGRTLKNVIGVSFETRLREIYSGEGLFPATHSLLAGMGFRLISKGGRSVHYAGETVEMDVAYVRGIDSLSTPLDVVKAVLFCVCHENICFAAHLVRNSSLAADEKTRLLKMLRKDFECSESPETLLMKLAINALARKGTL